MPRQNGGLLRFNAWCFIKLGWLYENFISYHYQVETLVILFKLDTGAYHRVRCFVNAARCWYSHPIVLWWAIFFRNYWPNCSAFVTVALILKPCPRITKPKNVKIMSMVGSAPEMTQEQALQAQNQQMKDFLSTYNKTTQVFLFLRVLIIYFPRFVSTTVSRTSHQHNWLQRRKSVDESVLESIWSTRPVWHSSLSAAIVLNNICP